MDFVPPNLKDISGVSRIARRSSSRCWKWPTTSGGFGIRMRWNCFRRLDRDLWEEVHHNPVKLLGIIDQKKLGERRRQRWVSCPVGPGL